MLLRMIGRCFLGVVFFGLVLFFPAGTVAWAQAWIFIVLFTGCSVATAVWMAVTDPDLLAARTKSPMSADQKPRDRLLMAAILAAFWPWFVLMALDARRFGWSQVPLWAQVLGAALVAATFVGWFTVLRANRFAATNVRLQHERGQTVISTGPYAAVRHPMYAYTVLLLIGTPLLLGSLWGLLGVLLLMPLFALRTLSEEAMLMDGLAGYRDYAAKVRFRLVPGLW
jgi:protein-S-isoprenylcysteine O-methyltransferase Ste14